MNGTLLAEGMIGKDTHRDTFNFTLWPSPKPPATRGVHLFDPSGKTTNMLSALEIPFEPWNPDLPLPNTARSEIFVLGENALRTRPDLLARLPFLARSGARILVCRHSPDWLRDGPEFRIANIVTRQVFPVDPKHPLLDGLERSDLSDWRAESSIVEKNPSYPEPDKFAEMSGEEPMHYRRSGTLGAVSSAPIEKPHLSGWRPLLETEFDLTYTPLMEQMIGQGIILWSTLDLEDNVPLDPAATRLASNLFAYLSGPLLSLPESQTLLIGSEDWANRLRNSGLIFSLANDTAPIPPGNLVVLDPALPVTSALEIFVEDGGRVLVLPYEEDPKETSSLAFGATLKKEPYFIGSHSVPPWPIAKGISVSDLRFRTDIDAWLISGGCEVGAEGLLGRKNVGRGGVVYIMINPWRMDVEKIPALRTTRWRATRAFHQILANAGARFQTDADSFDPALRNRLWLREGWRAAFTQRVESNGKPISDPGISPTAIAAAAPEFEDSAWKEVLLPAPYHHPGWWEYFGGEWRNADGEALFRKKVSIPTAWGGKNLTLSLGKIADNDAVFFNGEKIGTTQGRDKTRLYTIPGRLVKTGDNTLAVRVFNTTGRGGILGNPGSDWPGENSLVIDDALWLAPTDTSPGSFLGLYHPDYRNDSGWGDDPYRYWKW